MTLEDDDGDDDRNDCVGVSVPLKREYSKTVWKIRKFCSDVSLQSVEIIKSSFNSRHFAFIELLLFFPCHFCMELLLLIPYPHFTPLQYYDAFTNVEKILSCIRCRRTRVLCK